MADSFLRIGGITIAVRARDERVGCPLEGPISRFLIEPAPADVELEVVRLDRYEPPRGALLFDSCEVWQLYEDDGGYRIDCRSEAVVKDHPYKVATFNADFTRGTIAISPQVLSPLDYPLDEVIVMNLLARGRGVELHSCGVIDHDGRGHLFVGQSGAGKTTTARLWGDDAREIISDDRIIIRDVDGVLMMFGTPWHGEAELSSPSVVPLSAVYLLTQSTENAVQALPASDAVARLFCCCFPLFHDPAGVGYTISMLETIAQRVPVSELRFTRDRAAVDVIRTGPA
jgi:hypothetical protein